MNSATSSRRPNWILTTCRGRLEHLRESLPSWLERMPRWDPVVMCCDDPQAEEYAAGELHLAQRGFCVGLAQGQFFNRLEACRAGINLIGSGFDPAGQAITARNWQVNPVADDDMVAFLDADTVAIPGTTDTRLRSIGPNDVGISGTGIRDDMGLIVASVRVFREALALIRVGSFVGYGPEDCALRVACWTVVRKPFVRLPSCWARKRHSDRLRTAFHERSMGASSKGNCDALGDLVARIVRPGDMAQCHADCQFGAGRNVTERLYAS
jgi:hypothetical protein